MRKSGLCTVTVTIGPRQPGPPGCATATWAPGPTHKKPSGPWQPRPPGCAIILDFAHEGGCPRCYSVVTVLQLLLVSRLPQQSALKKKEIIRNRKNMIKNSKHLGFSLILSFLSSMFLFFSLGFFNLRPGQKPCQKPNQKPVQKSCQKIHSHGNSR